MQLTAIIVSVSLPFTLCSNILQVDTPSLFDGKGIPHFNVRRPISLTDFITGSLTLINCRSMGRRCRWVLLETKAGGEDEDLFNFIGEFSAISNPSQTRRSSRLTRDLSYDEV